MIKPLRYLLVWAIWPLVYLADRLRGVNPPARLRTGLNWARDGRHPPTIRTSDKPAEVGLRVFCATCAREEGQPHEDWCHREGMMTR